jgi:hypothetical protein
MVDAEALASDLELFGYPTLAVVLFVVASVAGLWLVITSLLHDVPRRGSRRT